MSPPGVERGPDRYRASLRSERLDQKSGVANNGHVRHLCLSTRRTGSGLHRACTEVPSPPGAASFRWITNNEMDAHSGASVWAAGTTSSAPVKLTKDGGDAAGGLGRGLVFPHSGRRPSVALQSRYDLCVALRVALELRAPVLRVGPGRHAMIWASVPEATVHEDREPGSRKRDVHADGPSEARSNAEVLAKAKTGAM